MYSKPLAYCPACKKLIKIKTTGACPECKNISYAFPEFMRLVRLRTKEMKRLTEKYPVALHWLSMRCEVELGKDLEPILTKAAETIDAGFSDVFLPYELPKLDIVAIALSHQKTGELIVIHDDHYDPHFYWHSSRHEPVSMGYAQGNGLHHPVFQCEAENLDKALLFFELQLLLHLFQAQNRLWYAALSEGYYIMPDQIFGWQHSQTQ